MYSELRTLLYDAEVNYLKRMEIQAFKLHVASLQERLEVYERLRDREIDIFQPIADQLLEAFPEASHKLLEQALLHWLSVMRCCAMAMLLNNPEFLARRLLEWLTDIVQAHQMELLENNLYNLLELSLKNVLSEQQFALLQPFLEQARSTLLDSKTLTETLG